VLSFVTSICAMLLLWAVYPKDYDFGSATKVRLCCAVLCCAVLCCAVLCCAVLCCAVLCCAVLCCAVLCKDHVYGSATKVPLCNPKTSVLKKCHPYTGNSVSETSGDSNSVFLHFGRFSCASMFESFVCTGGM